MAICQAFKFRLYPNPEQEQALVRQFGCSRFVYNYFLRERMEFYAAHKGERKQGLTYYDTTRQLTQLKQLPDYGWLKEANSQALQAALRDLNAAYTNFFEGRAGFPQFKPRRAKQTFRVPQHFALDADHERLRIPKITPIRIVVHRPLIGTPKRVTISRTPSGRYFASILCELDETNPSHKVEGKELGLDLGLLSFATTSEGNKIVYPQALRQSEKRLCRLQRRLSRKTKGSKNREKARAKLARLHEKVADRRADFLHKQSCRLVDESQAIYVESLNVKGMLANHRLAKSISDVSWGEFIRQLRYKGVWRGCRVEAIDRFCPTSKQCHRCGHVNRDLRLSDREWDCPGCHAHHDRDVNAAINILHEGAGKRAIETQT